MVTFFTVLSSRPPMEPMERPWPPEQVPPLNSMFWIPLLGCHRRDRGMRVGRGSHLAGVDGNAVILILDGGTTDVDTVTLANVEAIGVVAAVVITVGVVDGDIEDVEVGSLHTDRLNWGVLDGQILDGRVLQVVGVHELGLGLAAVRTLGIPPARAITVDDSALRLGDGDVLAGEADQGPFPFFVAEGGGSFEGDLDPLAETYRGGE